MAKKATRKRAPKKAAQAEVTDAPSASAVETLMDGVVGQERAVGVLRSAMDSQRVHHAWIFTGPKGVGKRTTALAFARELLLPAEGDVQRASIDAQLRRGHHPDLHPVSASLASVSRDAEIRKRKQTTLPRDVVAEFLVEPAVRTRVVTANTVASKVFIVLDAHMMGDAAQNLLLKTLEEPPAGTVILLVTQSEDRLLATIRSRCQRVAFGTLGIDEMAGFAGALAGGLSDNERRMALILSGGSPGRLAQVIAGGLVGWANALDGMFRAAEAGKAVPELGPEMTRLVNEEAERQVAGNKLASKEAANRRAAADMLGLVAERNRRLLERSSGDEALAMRRVLAIEAVAETERLLASNVPMQLAFGLLSAELTGAANEPAV